MATHAQFPLAVTTSKAANTAAAQTAAAASKDQPGFDLARNYAPGHSAGAAANPVATPRGEGSGAERARIVQIRHLQRTHGNRAVERRIREARTSEAEASHEEIERVDRKAAAKEAAAGTPPSLPSAPPASSSSGGAGTLVQREAANDSAPSFAESIAWSMADRFAPQLTPILRKGPEGLLDWLKDRAAAAGNAIDNLLSPVHAIAGIGTSLSARFTPMLGALKDAATKIAANDCSPISQAADKIEKTAESIITPVIEKLQPVVKTVQDVLNAAWDKIGAPIWQWIKDYASQQWKLIQDLAGWVWDLGAPLRALGSGHE